jgi:hypothetical protein
MVFGRIGCWDEEMDDGWMDGWGWKMEGMMGWKMRRRDGWWGWRNVSIQWLLTAPQIGE